MPPKKQKRSFPKTVDKLEFEDKLIQFVEPLKHVWQLSHPDYKNKLKRQNSFGTIGIDMDETADMCEQVWKNLRSQYFACKRSLPTGTGSEDETRPSFRHFTAMGFLSDNAPQSETFTNVNNSQADIGLGDCLDHSSENIQNIATTVDELPTNSIVFNLSAGSTLQTPTSNGQDSGRTHKKFGGKRKLDPMEEELLKFVKEKEESKPDDELDFFAKSMACKLRRLENRTAAELRIKFEQLIFDAEFN